MYERRNEPLIDASTFVRRVIGHVTFALVVVGGSLAIGAIGFYVFAGLDWLDAFLNSAMMLTTMGPVTTIETNAGKVFMSIFAFYSELIFLVVAGVVFAPIIHRFLHYFLGQDGDKQ
jgi:hypothetical protein